MSAYWLHDGRHRQILVDDDTGKVLASISNSAPAISDVWRFGDSEYVSAKKAKAVAERESLGVELTP